jgi:hypothetical protein
MRRIGVSCLLLLCVLAVVHPPVLALAPGRETLDTLRQTAVPARDPADLARRLLGITTITPIPRAPEHQVGDIAQFTALNNDKSAAFNVSAQLWYKTPHVYMWFQVGYKPNLDDVKRSADIFEEHIYPTVHKYFGQEGPPLDGDPHLSILHVRGLGGSIVGYFDSSSEYPKAIVPDSNEQHIFFVNLDYVKNGIGADYYLSTLAHEFQHMVHDNVDPNEEGWLNEGLAVLSQLLNGYPESGYQDAFMASPNVQLNTWSPDLNENGAHYGAAYLFVTYFLERFGEDALRALVANRQKGLESVASTLQNLNVTDPATQKTIKLDDFFADWTMANLLNNPKVGDGRFAHPRLTTGLSAPRMQKAVVSPAPQELQVSEWGTTYLDLAGSGRYHFNLQCSPTVKVVPAEAHSGQKMWWSNRGDNSDMRLTRAFDLTGVQKATLSFWLWYAIEKDWDYGYVEVSTDGGATWTALSTQDSVPGGGHANPYGPAYTGFTGASTASATWRQQTVDLTPYAGKTILIRFEYLTDDAVNEAGMLIDDIRIPEINYTTDAEAGDDGWQAEGWVRIDNVLPQTYLVQMAEYGPTPRVFKLLTSDGGNSGNWALDVGGEVSHLVIAVSGLTEFTTQKAACQYQLEVVSSAQ